MTIKQKLTTGMAAGTMLASVFSASAFAATDVVIADNGNNSLNGVLVVNVNANTVTQSNTAVLTNNVTTTGNTGGNTVNGNNGAGDKSVTSGNVTNDVTVRNTSGNNVATVSNCGCDEDVDIRVRDNGNKSINLGGVVNWNQSSTTQTNTAILSNTVNTKGKTGKNKANNNNGQGDKSVTTKDVTNTVTVTNKSGSNKVK